jgi:hypothetical protein
VEIDLSALGVVNTAMAAMFSKLGVPIKTAVSAAVLEAAYEGRFTPTPIHFGQSVHDKVDRQAARFYELEVSQVCLLQAGLVGGRKGWGGVEWLRGQLAELGAATQGLLGFSTPKHHNGRCCGAVPNGGLLWRGRGCAYLRV